MTPEEWQRLKTVFQQALDQPPHARRAWLAEACAGEPSIRREAEALLEAHETAGDFLEHSAVLPAEPALAPGTRVGPYEIIDELGRGGMGVVYVATDHRLGRRVALKALPDVRADDNVLRERLRREARAAATISHPSVATIYALEEIDDRLFITSEYVQGATLRDEMARGPIEPARVRAIAIEVASALAAAHDAGVVHRDLKPENILLTINGRVKVVDFGIAQMSGPPKGGPHDDATRLTRDGALLGTPAYMAPEQLLGTPVDARTDIFALGVVLQEMLTGRHPMQSSTGAEAVAAPGDGEPYLRVARHCAQIDPAARYPSARAVLHALERASVEPPRPAGGSARWWWEFHQGTAALVYWITIVAAWRGRGLLGGATGRWFFAIMLAAIIVAANLRLHLWFTSRFYPAELPWLKQRVSPWIRIADWIFAVALVSAGLLIGEDRSAIAVVLLGVGIGAAVAFLLIEPATTRAAFKEEVELTSGAVGTHRGT